MCRSTAPGAAARHTARAALIVALACAARVGGAVGADGQVTRDRAVPEAAAGTASIAGRVAIEVGGSAQPVRRARVTLESDALSRAQTSDTDTDGRYQFDRLPAGRYYLRAEKAGFVLRLSDARRAFERPPPLEIATGQRVRHEVWMVRGAAVEDQVLLTSGAPAVNIVVSAVRMTYLANGRRPVAVRQVKTDDRGRFRVHTLPAGEYFIEAGPDPIAVLTQPTPPGRRPSIIARGYFPNASRLEAAQAIALETGQELTALTVTLSKIPVASVAGQVVDSTGAPARLMMVRVQRVGGPVGEVRGALLPEGRGFSYPRVPAGEYWVMGVARPSPPAALEFAATRLTVGDQDISNIVLTTAKGAVVHGRVEADGQAAPLGSLQVLTHDTEFELPSLADADTPGASPAPVAADGSFLIDGLFGPRLIRVSRLPAGWTLQAVLLDGVDITDTPVDFRGRDTPHALRLLVTSRTGLVSGVVRDETGAAAIGARVVVFAESESAWGFRSRLIRATESGAEGRYAIDGLLGGQYFVVATPYLEDGSWMDPGVLRRLRLMAELVTVPEAGRLTFNLVVKP